MLVFLPLMLISHILSVVSWYSEGEIMHEIISRMIYIFPQKLRWVSEIAVHLAQTEPNL